MWSIKTSLMTRLSRFSFLKNESVARPRRLRARLLGTAGTALSSSALVLAVCLSSGPSTAYAQQSLNQKQNLRDNAGTSKRKEAPAQFRSIDQATSYIQGQHPGAKILKVVQRQRDDGSNVAKFRILTADGRMKNVSVTVD